MQWELSRLKDPKSGKIPGNIRARELEFARNIQARSQYSFKKGTVKQLDEIYATDWSFRGPTNIGGRTRALAVDLNYNGSTNRRILAGGISGGMYLTEDAGKSWRLTTSLADLASVTCIAQDPNNRNIWYYGTGEYLGNSANAGGNKWLGNGLFKSTDGGENWIQLISTSNENIATFDLYWDIVWNLAVHPTNSAVFAATFGKIYRSQDGGNSWQTVLGNPQTGNYNEITDVAIASDGSIYTTLSRNGGSLTDYGVFHSTDNGNTWQNISPPALASDPYRMVLAVAPSNSNIVYLIVQATKEGESADDHQFFRYNAGTGNWANLSGNLPTTEQFPDDWRRGDGEFKSQGGYDLVAKVKPDNPNVVWIGGTCLYRSIDGGNTFSWVGGYHHSQANSQLYPNHYPDQHSIAFFPNNASLMISGHDGGLSYTSNNLQEPQTWVSLNNGYITTQFYAIAIEPVSGSDWLVGGMQDRSTWLTNVKDPNQPWHCWCGGDGGFCAIAPGCDQIYVSSQYGHIYRYTWITNKWLFSYIFPASVKEKEFLFVAPYQLDPNVPERMYLAGGNQVWYNSNLEAIPLENSNSTDINWHALSNSAVSGWVTAVTICKQPANRLYFGATDFYSYTCIKRLDNAPSNPVGISITPPGIVPGSYPSSIGVNPNNGNELLLTCSNYQVPGVWYSENGGSTWQDIEGNLAGDNGPSVRWAIILPTNSGTLYYLATSTGIYSTTYLNGPATTWMLEAENTIGNVVVDMLVARSEDGLIAAGTHGRGAYSATITTGSGQAIASVEPQSLYIGAKIDSTASKIFTIRNTGTANLKYDITTGEPGKIALQNQKATKMMTGATTSSGIANLQPLNEVNPISAERRSAMKIKSPGGSDVLFNDNGDIFVDGFFAHPDGQLLCWMNKFILGDFDFQLEKFRFVYRTEFAQPESIWCAIYDNDFNLVIEDKVGCIAAPQGTWYEVTLENSIQCKNGENFYIAVGGLSSVLAPAGIDLFGATINCSYYYDFNAKQWKNVNQVWGYANAAFVIWAIGTAREPGDNQLPVAVAQISKTEANIHETITFDASQSYDPDGEIVSYQWNFGDGSSSTKKVSTHGYAIAKTYTYQLIVTDDKGGTGNVSGTIIIIENQKRLSIVPKTGTIPPGSAHEITVTFDARGATCGTYIDRVSITSNGGDFNLPVEIEVSVTSVNELLATLPGGFRLHQNYPNPFNPTTTISFQLPESEHALLTVYDVLGREVARLVDERKAPGIYKADFDASHLPSGIYMYRFTAGEFSEARKLLLIK
ncbi:T9SS type A sorting domain-containing protein [candidate division KSB1 bacterium]|nr:T9SS type A sorting domain-containing protein [candidate division KSB1 bacterium]